MAKRLFDIVLSLLAIVLLSPVFLLTLLFVWVTSGRPVFFRQKRPGKQGKPFVMYKFRTMTNEKDASNAIQPADHRFTRFGHFLRKTSLDELPGFLNIIRGDMSLVGPRPLRMEYLPHYTPTQHRRHEVKPGLTGWAQVNGRNLLSWERKFELDVWYVDHRTFWLDMKILLLTIPALLKREGINQQGDRPVEPFKKTENNE